MKKLMLAVAMTAFTCAAHAADYVIIDKQATVNVSAELAWSRIGDYCAIADWSEMECKITSGDGATGTVRWLTGDIDEVIVGLTPLSHTYVQTKGNLTATGYHGTVQAIPGASASATIRWVAIYDQSVLPEENRAAMQQGINGFYQAGIENMKKLAEGK